MTKFFLLTIMALGFSIVAAAQNKSVYTSLATKDCRTIESTSDEGGSYRGKCKGVAGYQLELLEGDIRQSVNIVAPGKSKYELNLWTTVSGAFSSVGEKAEWRLRGGKPYALILRFNASENAEDSSQITSYLVVAKITKNAACVTDVVKPGTNQNVEARSLADNSANKPCYTRGN